MTVSCPLPEARMVWVESIAIALMRGMEADVVGARLVFPFVVPWRGGPEFNSFLQYNLPALRRISVFRGTSCDDASQCHSFLTHTASIQFQCLNIKFPPYPHSWLDNPFDDFNFPGRSVPLMGMCVHS